MKINTKKILKLTLIIILIPIILLWLIRAILPVQIDDVTPKIPCEESLLNRADVYYVIPKFDNTSISQNKEWCEKILSKNKKLAMHGVTHEYLEFATHKNESYVEEGIQIFEECFGYKPEKFKPPNLGWTKENNWMKKIIDVDLEWNQVFHKVYHCNDTGATPNWLIRIF